MTKVLVAQNLAGIGTFKNTHLIQARIYHDYCNSSSKGHQITVIHHNLLPDFATL